MLVERQVEPGLAIAGVIADDSADLQVLDDSGGQVQVVLDQQQMNMHGKTLGQMVLSGVKDSGSRAVSCDVYLVLTPCCLG
ncbi:hypothetical protein PFLmoz3_00491 [Pseudomonas fluorescens]|uniref:Uncharacterized protein n=1 Tax=Pseudomonas fluorescens TaxID=294 RepID=A0A120G948_PSEFL|nr:hypothetical protein PFLmoz3_00491 [Pseudomonas fluorescens]